MTFQVILAPLSYEEHVKNPTPSSLVLLSVLLLVLECVSAVSRMSPPSLLTLPAGRFVSFRTSCSRCVNLTRRFFASLCAGWSPWSSFVIAHKPCLRYPPHRCMSSMSKTSKRDAQREVTSPVPWSRSSLQNSVFSSCLCIVYSLALGIYELA